MRLNDGTLFIQWKCLASQWAAMHIGTQYQLIFPSEMCLRFSKCDPEHMLHIKVMNISSEIDLSWMAGNVCEEESTLIQVMAWCREATRHSLSQYWPWSLSPYNITRPLYIDMTRRSGLIKYEVIYIMITCGLTTIYHGVEDDFMTGSWFTYPSNTCFVIEI